jgi:hypothetical protein
MKKIISRSLIILYTNTLSAQSIEVKRIRADIEFLADDRLKGRATSTEEETAAADYLAKQFKQIGLQPKGTDGYIYPFHFRINPNPHDTAASTMVEKDGKNIVGFLDNGAVNTVVIGAHYDHLGLGDDHNSLEVNPEGKIHNGADDNASGTAGVLELARYFSGNNRKEAFNFLFICFSGEELGLIGSKKYCENPTVDLKMVNYMINMDMIGRLNDSTRSLIVYGVGTAPDWVSLITNTSNNFRIKQDSAGVGPSDHTSFYLKDIPVLHFFTGQHSDYHKPSDDINKINYEGEKDVLSYIVKLIEQTESKPKMQFLTTRNPVNTLPKMKITMGIMPDYAWEGKGVHIDGVTDGRPAALAGIKKGDVILEFGDRPINNMMDYMECLAKYEKGSSVPVTIKRGEEVLKLQVQF